MRDRIKKLVRVRAGDLIANPKNWRTHPPEQRAALKALMSEIGFADAILVRESDQGYIIIDGHLRADLDPEAQVPCLVLDVSEAESDKLLALLDPLALKAETDQKKLDELLATISTDSDDLELLISELTSDETEVELRQLETKPPPKFTWVLLGIPTVRFGEIAEIVDALGAVPEILIETSSNDGPDLRDRQPQPSGKTPAKKTLPAKVSRGRKRARA